MAAIITPPDARQLLPPLLACLPTAFVSPHPPPALLPLLSPILRQRITLLSGNTSSGNGGWLSLLSWDPTRAKKLGKHLEGIQFEAHPVSGELEIEDVDTISYRRLDEETLQSRLEVSEFELLPIFVWVDNDDQNGGTGAGWKVAELRVLEDKEDGTQWTSSLTEAKDSSSKPAPTPPAAVANLKPSYQPTATFEDDDDDNDDYWNMYDATPGRTPARTPVKRSPAPTQQRPIQQTQTQSNIQVGPTAEELEYFARYASEVQPALDSHDPDEEVPDTESSLTGEEFTRAVNPTQNALYESNTPDHNARTLEEEEEEEVKAPRATSPSSQGSVERLERLAMQQQLDGEGKGDAAETGVRQFISTEIKSLYRLARSVGIGRSEFGEIVGREVGVLGFMDNDD